MRENTGIGGGGFASWCDRPYYDPKVIVDEPVTCLWCAAQRRRLPYVDIHHSNPCAEIPL